MKRAIIQDLIEWKNSPGRMPLIVRGARQTGKSYIIKNFGQNYFQNIITVNFELEPRYKNCFKTLAPKQIIQEIEVLSNQNVIPGETLLFLDEIQECPPAIQALRYFFENLSSLHVIGAGSLLEFSLGEETHGMAVGRVEFQYLYPMTFSEMLMALAEDKVLEFMKNLSVTDIIPVSIHEKLLELMRLYCITGGMPQVLAHYSEHRNLLQCRNMQIALLNTYRSDFGKYATRVQQQYCERVFEKAPTLICQHFKYTDIDPDLDGRSIKAAIKLLCKANVLTPIYYTSASLLPLSATQVEKRYKLLFLDIGLVQASSHISPELLLNQDLMQINKGTLIEQFIGQHLTALSPRNDHATLYYWQRDARGSQAEVDYVIAVEQKIIPIEVKAGKTGRLKSLHLFMELNKSHLGIKLSQENFNPRENIWVVPLYLIEELPRLIKSQQ
jgi:predicted AAA+ superfamily ATPase